MTQHWPRLYFEKVKRNRRNITDYINNVSLFIWRKKKRKKWFTLVFLYYYTFKSFCLKNFVVRYKCIGIGRVVIVYVRHHRLLIVIVSALLFPNLYSLTDDFEQKDGHNRQRIRSILSPVLRYCIAEAGKKVIYRRWKYRKYPEYDFQMIEGRRD